jgi:ankyrin repeat protein
MVRFLLEAGADQEHKTDEMHTALMEASMDGHVEVARLLLDSGAQVPYLRSTLCTIWKAGRPGRKVRVSRILDQHLGQCYGYVTF